MLAEVMLQDFKIFLLKFRIVQEIFYKRGDIHLWDIIYVLDLGFLYLMRLPLMSPDTDERERAVKAIFVN